MIKSSIKLSSSLILASLLLGATASVGAVYADDGGTYNTEAGVNFLENTDKTDPVDPDNPDPNKPVEPEKPDGTDPETGTDGPLSIDYVSDFDFGNQKISTSNQTYYAKAQSYKGDKQDSALYAQVTDSRGTGAGWRLNLSQPNQLTAENRDGSTSELKGAQISIKDVTAHTQSNSESLKPDTNNNITLSPGNSSSQNVMSATSPAGQGVWVARMGSTSNLSTDANGKDGTERNIDKSVSLYVPGASNKKADAKYTTDLVWELSDTPIAS